MRKGSIILILSVLFNQINGQQMELVAGHVLFRHGDRTPYATYPTDPMKETDWPNGYGQLTIAGIEQEHRLGAYFRTRYGSLLSPKYKRSEIYVRSTDYDRTLMSAESILIGLYPLVNSSNDGVPIQPIPIHTVPKMKDTLLSSAGCPRYRFIKKNKYQRDELKRFSTYYEPFLQKLEVWTNIKNISLHHTWSLTDTLFIENIYNKAPSWANADVLRNLSDIKDILYHLTYSNDDVKRIKGGSVIKDIWENMFSLTVAQPYWKVKMYSAHDTTIAAVLSFLGINYPHQPPYASAVFVDLYKQNSTYFVKVEYLNVTDSNISYPYVLNGCPEVMCPFDKFTSIYLSRFPASFEVECAIPSSSPPSSNRSYKIGIAILTCIVVLLLVITFLLLVYNCLGTKESDTPLIATEASSLTR